MNITPMKNKLFVLPDKAPEQTASGIILSDFSKKRPTSGTIVRIGPEVTDFTQGQRIVYGEFCGQRITVEYDGEDTDIFIMTSDDILAVLE